MKKIMFNERYGVQSAVLTGAKDMTRRTIKGYYKEVKEYDANYEKHFIAETEDGDTVELKPHFEIGEKVAIAQSYEDLANSRYCTELGMMDSPTTFKKEFCGKGWRNKMFVKAEHMPHQILISDIKAERLQDISNEDAMREGVYHYDTPPRFHEGDNYAPWAPHVKPYKWDSDNLKYFCEARWAFKHLINKVAGGYIWNRNPWVFAYTFKLVK